MVLEDTVLSKSQVMQVVTALRNDNPQLFWVLNDLRYGVGGGSTVIQLLLFLRRADTEGASEKMNTVMGRDL